MSATGEEVKTPLVDHPVTRKANKEQEQRGRDLSHRLVKELFRKLVGRFRTRIFDYDDAEIYPRKPLHFLSIVVGKFAFPAKPGLCAYSNTAFPTSFLHSKSKREIQSKLIDVFLAVPPNQVALVSNWSRPF